MISRGPFALERQDMSFTIFGDTGSGAFSAEAALAEAGAQYTFQTISLEKNEQKAPAFLAINPSGKMPALRLPEGEIVTESAAILLTIADYFPNAHLLPAQASFARASAYRWIAFMASEIYPAVEISDYPERFAPDANGAEAVREKARTRVRERLLLLERALAGPWFLSTGFSAVDIYAAMFSRWSAGAEWRDANLPRLVELANNLAQRPAIAPVWQRHFVQQ